KTQERVHIEDFIVNTELNPHVVYMAVRAQFTNLRRGTSSTRVRSEVRGGGRKPYRQKGTGRARTGSIRSPIWVGGGRIFGPSPHKFKFSLPKKVKRLARRCAFSIKVKSGKLKIIEDPAFNKPRTSELLNILKNFQIDDSKILIIVPEYERNFVLSGRNIPNLKFKRADSISTYDLLDCNSILMTRNSVEIVNTIFSKK
ncbi:MAG: 50S ribosomal protein L4, partial [Fidelibacterota bacterium]